MLLDFERFIDFINQNKLTLRASEYLREVTLQVNKNEILFGTGSPEGVISAEIGKQYTDINGTTGNILYIKKTGIGKTGWTLV